MTITLPPKAEVKPAFNVLIADDDQGNRETLRDLLEARGFRTTLAADGGEAVEIERIGPKQQEAQVAALRELRAGRDGPAATACLDRLEDAARGTENLLHPLKEALAAYATIGECCERLRRVFGEYQPPDIS